MEIENLNIEEIMEARRHAVEESLHTITVEELNALTEDLFPYLGHPWREKFLSVINGPASGTFYHAIADDRVHILYSHAMDIGMWFVPGGGKGPLEPGHLKFLKELVETRR